MMYAAPGKTRLVSARAAFHALIILRSPPVWRKSPSPIQVKWGSQPRASARFDAVHPRKGERRPEAVVRGGGALGLSAKNKPSVDFGQSSSRRAESDPPNPSGWRASEVRAPGAPFEQKRA